ncbi:AgmX/PglI C-terminal domain-containing protein [candidate division KSB1 bacterium]|nr:AgmX/PglI C-terminal domain-containing protein [candidate division KSB1 bacterium]
MKQKKATLTAQIRQGSKRFEYSLSKNDVLTIGKSPKNDIVVYGKNFPKKQTLIECKTGECIVHFSKEVSGEIVLNNSKLSLGDLITHNLLPQKNNLYTLHITHGHKGTLRIGDADIQFTYNGMAPERLDVKSYTWHKALSRSLSRDLAFKGLFLLFVVLEVMFALYVKNYRLKPVESSQVEKVPERIAKFVIDKPGRTAEPGTGAEQADAVNVADQSGDGDTEKTESSQPPQSGGAGGGNAERSVSSKGLLALIGGRGESGGDNSAANFIIDRGLTQELDELVGQKPLRKGKGFGHGEGTGVGSGSGEGEGLDELLRAGLEGDVDDLIRDVKPVQRVDLKKRGNVNIEKPGQMRGSQRAMVQRSADNVLSVIRSQHGRVMYTYNKYLRSDPELRGKVSYDVTIQANGQVSKVEIVETTIRNSGFIRELSNILRRLKFQSIPEGAVTVNVPFVFNRSDL